MELTAQQIRRHRLAAHHLAQKLPPLAFCAAAGACGLQNTPPGAWETALFNRVEGCTLQDVRDALYTKKTLLQAWSYRGAPVVFPTGESGVFLTPLLAQPGERPWIYTLGITGALEHLQMSFDELLPRVQKAARYLDGHTVQSKEALDSTLAALVEQELPAEKRALWRAPSIYGSPDRQTMGGAAVSFLLRPCSFASLVVFGERQGASPTFTSYQNWVGRAPTPAADADRALARKFLHCYGPATVDALAAWLGCSPKQARRLWAAVAEEVTPVQALGKPCFALTADLESLCAAGEAEEKLLLLGAHDPYLDLRDRAAVLPDPARQKAVWKLVGNPGAVLQGGRVTGIWKSKTFKEALDLSVTLWEPLAPAARRALEQRAQEYAAFRLLRLRKLTVETE